MRVTGELIGTVLDAVRGRGGQIASLDEIAELFNAAINIGADGAYDGPTAPQRLAALVAQSAQESAWFRTTREGGSMQPYAPYIGRTFIQITFADNYRSFGSWCAGRGLLPAEAGGRRDWFVEVPERLEAMAWAALGPVWYFQARGCLPYADDKNWTAVGGIINTGSADRVAAGNADRVKVCQAAYDYLVNQGEEEAMAPPTSLQLALAQWMTDRIGQFVYSQQDRYDNITTDGDGRSADCSSVVDLDYRETAGITVGSYTDAQAGNGRPVFDTNLEDVDQALALLMPGDLVLVKHHVPAGSPYWDHVEMYVGGGKTCGHGGPGAGPQLHDFRTLWNQEMQLIARRYVSDEEEPAQPEPEEEEDEEMSDEDRELLNAILDAVRPGISGVQEAGTLPQLVAAMSEAIWAKELSITLEDGTERTETAGTWLAWTNIATWRALELLEKAGTTGATGAVASNAEYAALVQQITKVRTALLGVVDMIPEQKVQAQAAATPTATATA